MDLQTVKYGLSIAVCGTIGIIVFFAFYIKMGQRIQKSARNRD